MVGGSREGVLLVAHGTIRELGELPEFLAAIRRGRPPTDDLLREMCRRYSAIGASPLVETTLGQARALAAQVGLPVLVGMRFGRPPLREALLGALQLGLSQLTVIPMAPYSVPVYAKVVRDALESLRQEGEGRALDLRDVGPWGESPRLVLAHAELIRRCLPEGVPANAALILTAHSLPLATVRGGDDYPNTLRRCGEQIGLQLGVPVEFAYQSQGADGGQWLEPSLDQVMGQCAERGARGVVVAPFGFLSEHVETLYDLDIEARRQAVALGIDFLRVPALGLDSGLVSTLVELVSSARNVTP
jgi:protoporphyrin/coproporphyrin ferrochelatase